MKWQWSTRRCRERWTRQRSTPCSSWDRPPGRRLRARLTDLLGDGDVGLAGTRACRPRPGAVGRGRDRAPDRGRRLRRLLLLARALFQRRQPDQTGRRPAVPELAPPAGRLPRPSGVGGPERDPRSSARRDRARPRSRENRLGFGPERLLDFELELGFLTGPGPAGGEPIPPADAAGITSSASRSSTTGAPDRSRPGSTSRSAPSSASRSRPRSRPGLRRWRRWSRSAFRAPPRSRRLRPTCGATRPGRSTSSSRSRWPPLERPTSR